MILTRRLQSMSWSFLFQLLLVLLPTRKSLSFPIVTSSLNRRIAKHHFTAYSSSSSTSPSTSSEYSIRDSFNLIVLGDLHMEDDMTAHKQARDDCLAALDQLSLLPCPPTCSTTTSNNPAEANPHVDASSSSSSSSSTTITVESLISQIQNLPAGNLTPAQLEMMLAYKREGHRMKSYLVSLGDLGRKDIRHEQGDAGTTLSFQLARDFFQGFGGLPFDVVTGNHDLEGLDEFSTDVENLHAWMDCFHKVDGKPYFQRYVGEKTLLLGLSTVRFRDAPYSSHECHIDDEQLQWFTSMVESHPHSQGWKILVFSHAPIMGSNLRVLQNVHVMNGCAWLNHGSDTRKTFIDLVRKNSQIKLWFSGHFHLSHDFQDALSRVNQCTFVQVGVIGPASTRDDKRQTRIIQGNDQVLKIYTVNHYKRTSTISTQTGHPISTAELRLDAIVDLNNDGALSRQGDNSQEINHNDWFSAYVPEPEDGCYLATPDGRVASQQNVESVICWWHMADGAVLGVHEGQVVEYDADTLSPLGIVVNKKQLKNREVLVVDEGTAVVLIDPDTEEMEVIHPNADGSYSRKFQRNKRIRQEEKARETAAKLWLQRKQHTESFSGNP